MLRMMFVGLLIPLGVGVLAAMELRAPVRSAAVVVQPAAETAGTSDSHVALRKADRLEVAVPSSNASVQPAQEHDPEKRIPVFRQDHAQIKELERDDSNNRHHALVEEQPAPLDERISLSEEQGISVGSSKPQMVINRHRHDAKSKKVTVVARLTSKPKTIAVKRTAAVERRKATSETEPCRLSAFGGLRKALNSLDCEI